jgi:hypothetical protein
VIFFLAGLGLDEWEFSDSSSMSAVEGKKNFTLIKVNFRPFKIILNYMELNKN